MISDYKFYLKLLARRLPMMLILFLCSTAIGIVLAIRLPKVYQTNAKLLVEAAQIPGNMVQSTIQIAASEQLEIIQNQLMTRANLIDVANQNQIFPDADDMTPDEIVNAMRERTKIKRASGRNQATLMIIGFEGEDPRKIAAVVNQYVTIVLALNTTFRTSQAEGTHAFFEQEVQSLSQSIDQKNEKISAFKAENGDALPENLNYRLNRQALLQERLARGERDLEGLEKQRENVERIYKAKGGDSPEEKQLRSLKNELRVALSVYSEQNPKVRSLRNQITLLEKQISEGFSSSEEDEDTPQATALDISMAELDSREETLKRDINSAKEELVKLEDAINRTPANTITLDGMQRDLQNLQNLYAIAVQRLAQARMGERIELSSKGEKITVLEAASVPSKPFKPNRKRIAVMGAALGLGLAGGFFVLLELLNQSIRRPVDIVSALEIDPLATIPRIETASHRRWRRITQVVALVVVITGALASLWAVDTYYLPLDLLFEKLKDQIV